MDKIFRINSENYKYVAVALGAAAAENCLRKGMFVDKKLSDMQERSLNLFTLWAPYATDGDEFWGEGFFVKVSCKRYLQ